MGDSRAIMSCRRGKVIQELSLDHKASDEFEQKRIIENGGKIYQYIDLHSEPNSATPTPILRYSTKVKSTSLSWDRIELSQADCQLREPSGISRPNWHNSEEIQEQSSARPKYTLSLLLKTMTSSFWPVILFSFRRWHLRQTQ